MPGYRSHHETGVQNFMDMVADGFNCIFCHRSHTSSRSLRCRKVANWLDRVVIQVPRFALAPENATRLEWAKTFAIFILYFRDLKKLMNKKYQRWTMSQR